MGAPLGMTRVLNATLLMPGSTSASGTACMTPMTSTHSAENWGLQQGTGTDFSFEHSMCDIEIRAQEHSFGNAPIH
jgi:hypothetical protein